MPVQVQVKVHVNVYLVKSFGLGNEGRHFDGACVFRMTESASGLAAFGMSRIIPAHRKLIVWQKSIDLAVEAHRLALGLPSYERYELAAQIRTAGVSTYANVAEGAGRRTPGEFSNFLSMARGSAMELESHTEYATKVGYLTTNDVLSAQEKAAEVIRILSSMMNNLKPFRYRESRDRSPSPR